MAENEQSQKQEEPRYEADYLLERADRLFGQPAYVVAGALAAESRQTHTEKQAQAAVDRFLGREVPVYDGAPDHEKPEELRSE